MLAAAYPAGALLASIPAGVVAARVGVKPTVVTGLVLIAATTVAFGFAGETWTLDLARFLQGVASAFSWTGGLAWLVAAAPANRRGQLIGDAFGAAIAGALFGPVLGGVAAHVGTRWAFSTVAAIALAQVAWAIATPSTPRREPQPLRMLGAALRVRTIQAAIWFVVLPALLFGTLGVLAPLRLSTLGFGALAVGATYLLSAGLEATASPLLGRLSDRHGRLLPLQGGLIASAAVAFVLPWPTNRFALAAVVVCAGVAFGSFWTPAMSMVTDAAEARGLDYGYAFALVNLAWAPGQAGGAAAGGALASVTRDAVPYLGLGVVCLVTLAALYRSRLTASPVAAER